LKDRELPDYGQSGPQVSGSRVQVHRFLKIPTTASRVYRFGQQDNGKILICIIDDIGTLKYHGMEVRRIN
jgi:hypothetical protein